MLTAIYLLCAMATLVLAGIGLHRLRVAPTLTLALIMPTLLAVPYDNFVIALGAPLVFLQLGLAKGSVPVKTATQPS